MSTIVSGKRAVMESIRSGRVSEVLVVRGGRESPASLEVIAAARAGGIRVREASREELDALAIDHRGFVARVRTGRQEGELGEREMASFPFAEDAIVVVLDGVEDPQNLGASARSAEAAGASMLVTRVRRSAPVTDAAMRASAGALAHLPHARVANISRALLRLQDEGFTVVGLDATAPVSVFHEPCPSGRIAVVIGSEGTGMSRLVRKSCDRLVALPMHGKVDSLNAAASLAAVLYGYVLPSRAGA